MYAAVYKCLAYTNRKDKDNKSVQQLFHVCKYKAAHPLNRRREKDPNRILVSSSKLLQISISKLTVSELDKRQKIKKQ